MIEGLDPDVVLMDVRMPEMDGIETTRELKARFPSLGIVALTGSEDQRAVRDMLVAGASGYVLKDSDGDEILYAVRQAVHGRRGALPRGHADGDRGAHRGARAGTTTHPSARDRPGGAARAGRATARADLTTRPRAPHAGHRDPRHGADARQGHRPRGGAWRDPREPRRPCERPGAARPPVRGRRRGRAHRVGRRGAGGARGRRGTRQGRGRGPRGPRHGEPEPDRRPPRDRGARRERARVLPRRRSGGRRRDPRRVGARGAGHRPRARHRPRGDAPHLRAAGAGREAEHPHPSGRRAGPHARAHVGQRDGRRRACWSRRDPRARRSCGRDAPVT